MDHDDLVEKLLLDLEARRIRDRAEAAAKYNKEVDDLTREGQTSSERLGANSAGVWRDIEQRKKSLKAEYDAIVAKDKETHARIDADIVAGKVDHVWIDKEQEKRYEQAKTLWNHEAAEMFDRYGRPLSADRQKYFRDEYGRDIFNKLVSDTNRAHDQREREEQAKRNEYAERTKVLAEQEAARVAALKHEQIKTNFEKSAEQLTDDRPFWKSKGPVDNDLERIKAQEKIDRAEVDRIKSRQINPVDQHTDVFERLRDQESQRQKTKDEHEQSETVARINRDIAKAREKAQQNPVETATTPFEAMMKRIRENQERDNGQGW